MMRFKSLLVACILILMLVVPASAQQILSNNAGTERAVWEIEGEPSLVINGFDLTPLNLSFPITVQALNIAITQAPAGSATAVVYGDSNGGSPADAVLLGQQTGTISGAGSVRFAFTNPVTVNSPVMWAGFYLPVGTEFQSDQQGTSVLTYWGWNPGSTVNVNTLSGISNFGPSDGSSPVNLDIGGVAIISVEIVQSGGTTTTVNPTTNTGGLVTVSGVNQQLVGSANVDFSPMTPYANCPNVLWDVEDVVITAQDAFDLYCGITPEPMAPTGAATGGIGNLERRGLVYSLEGSANAFDRVTKALITPVTHCMRPPASDINNAVIGVAYGAPRKWHIQQTVRYGDYICAELNYIGNLAYFVPRAVNPTTENVNLIGASTPIVSRRPVCSAPFDITFSIINSGLVATSDGFQITIYDQLVRNGFIGYTDVIQTGVLAAGETRVFTIEGANVINDYGEQHRIQIAIDSTNNISELNELDNVVLAYEYILDQGSCPD